MSFVFLLQALNTSVWMADEAMKRIKGRREKSTDFSQDYNNRQGILVSPALPAAASHHLGGNQHGSRLCHRATSEEHSAPAH